ncbi:MAG: hypothetical protein LUQ07_03720 [Methanospirillum sp.]|nr:hypothetical protein [Methanospirillum sp.]
MNNPFLVVKASDPFPVSIPWYLETGGFPEIDTRASPRVSASISPGGQGATTVT